MEKISTGIPGLDTILKGGVPKYSVNIIAGSPGSGKTILAQQIVYANTRHNNKSIYMTTVSEPSVKMIRYQQEFDFFDPDMVGSSVFYIDLGEILKQEGTNATLKMLEAAIQQYHPEILVIDSFKAIHDILPEVKDFRDFLFQLGVKLATWTTTTFLVGEYYYDELKIVPECTMVDGVIYLSQQGEKAVERHLQVIKMRGSDYISGKHAFRISSAGVTVYPRLLPETVPEYPVGVGRVETGISGLDTMLGGGLLKNSAVLVAGSSGTGKTILGLHFIINGLHKGKPGVIVSFEEEPKEIITNAAKFGWDLQGMVDKDLLRFVYESPSELCVDEHFSRIETAVSEIGAKRIMVDSINCFENAISNPHELREHMQAFIKYCKNNDITSFITSEIPQITGNLQISQVGVSFVVDTILLLRYVEVESAMKKAISVLKMRGSDHDKEIREFEITDNGIEIKLPFSNLESVLSGSPRKMMIEKMEKFFK